MFSTPQRGLSGRTASGTSETTNKLPGRMSVKGSIAATASKATTEMSTSDDNITAGTGKYGKGGNPTANTDTREPIGRNEKRDTERADGGGRCPGCGEDDETPRLPRAGEKSASRSHSWGVRGGKGSKWSLKALRRSLAEMGVDVPALWEDIHSVVIKTLIAIEAQVRCTACRFRLSVAVDHSHVAS